MGFTTRAHSSWGFRSRWILLAAVVLAAGAWRFHNLSNIFLLVDETDFFSQKLFLHPPRPLLEYALETRDATTNTWSWPAILWTACRLFCGTTKVARTPGALAGTGMVLAMFFLVYTLLPKDYPGNRFVPAIGAAIFTTIAMPQMEFSQRIYPSATAPLMGAILLLADLYVYRSLADKNGGIHQLLRSIGWYAFRRWPGCMYSSQLERVGGVINGVPGNRGCAKMPKHRRAGSKQAARVERSRRLGCMFVCHIKPKEPEI